MSESEPILVNPVVVFDLEKYRETVRKDEDMQLKRDANMIAADNAQTARKALTVSKVAIGVSTVAIVVSVVAIFR